MEHNVGICKRTQCETTENERVLTSVYGPLSSVDLGVVFLRYKIKICKMRVEIDMLTGGASVLGWLAARHRIDGEIRSDGAWFNALEAQMRVHAVNMRKSILFFCLTYELK